MTDSLSFDDSPIANLGPSGTEDTLHVDLDGFEGPLDLLLELARRQKVDLLRISILALTEQYLAFIEEARRTRLELAADYLVMAAWLAFLKSRLLLPEQPEDEGPSADELAAALALRLRRLEVVREAAKKLAGRDRLGRELFARGAPEPVQIHVWPAYEASLYDLLTAYALQRQKQLNSKVVLHKRQVWTLAEAREALERLMGKIGDWVALDAYFLEYMTDPERRATVLASTLSATLEMVKEGRLSVRQSEAFSPIWIKSRGDAVS